MKSFIIHPALRLAVAVSAIAVTSACGTQSQPSVVKSEMLQPEYCLGGFSTGVFPTITTYAVICNGSTHGVWKNAYSLTFRDPSQEALDALVADVDSQLAQKGIKPLDRFPAKHPTGLPIDEYGTTVYSNRPKADFSFCLFAWSGSLDGCSSYELNDKLERNIALARKGKADADWHGAEAYLTSVGFELVFSPGKDEDYPFAGRHLYVK